MTEPGEAGAVNTTPTRTQIVLARLVIVLSIAALVVGVFMHGVSADVIARTWQNMLDRPDGPLLFRFFLQPAMATLVALRDGIHDARTGRPPFMWTVITDPARRPGRLTEALIATSRIILLGLVMDTIYQIIEFKSFHPFEAVLMAFLLGLVPYLLLRGLITRIARRWVANPTDSRIT
jgi:hypothetical protein